MDDHGRIRTHPTPIPPLRRNLDPFTNSLCYAAPLGGCSSKLSGEHFITHALLRRLTEGGGQLRLSKFKWQRKDESTTVSAKNLKAKVLCEAHNSVLECYDRLGDRFCSLVVKSGEPGTTTFTGLFNGEDLERWLLKMLCGVTAMERKGWHAPLPWLNALFKTGGPVPTELGLWLRIQGFEMFGGLHWSATPIDDPAGGDPFGLRFHCCGMEFVLLTSQPGLRLVLPGGRLRPGLVTIESRGYCTAQIGIRYRTSPMGLALWVQGFSLPARPSTQV